jgi:hypothetical protein
MRFSALAIPCLLCGMSPACAALMEEPVPLEEEYADVLTYDEAAALEASGRGAAMPATETRAETFAPVYYPEPEEGYGEGGAPPVPVQVEKVELSDEPPEPKILDGNTEDQGLDPADRR